MSGAKTRLARLAERWPGEGAAVEQLARELVWALGVPVADPARSLRNYLGLVGRHGLGPDRTRRALVLALGRFGLGDGEARAAAAAGPERLLACLALAEVGPDDGAALLEAGDALLAGEGR